MQKKSLRMRELDDKLSRASAKTGSVMDCTKVEKVLKREPFEF
jgi:hypothetical protein